MKRNKREREGAVVRWRMLPRWCRINRQMVPRKWVTSRGDASMALGQGRTAARKARNAPVVWPVLHKQMIVSYVQLGQRSCPSYRAVSCVLLGSQFVT